MTALAAHEPAIYFCGCQACFSTWQSWGAVGADGLLHLTRPHCPHCDNDDYTQAEPAAEPAREEETPMRAPYHVVMIERGERSQEWRTIQASGLPSLAAARARAREIMAGLADVTECRIVDHTNVLVETIEQPDWSAP